MEPIEKNVTNTTKKEPIKLVTHDGSFHTDEVTATAVLRIIFKDVEIIRTRDVKEIEKGDIVYDVGAKYDGKKFFDHHQRSFNSFFSENFDVKQSSAGLIFKHFHEKLFEEFGINLNNYSELERKRIVDETYKAYFMGLDAIDNGDSRACPEIFVRNITSMVQSFNDTSSCQMKNFLRAVDFIEADLRLFFQKKIEYLNEIYPNTLEATKHLKDGIIISEEEKLCLRTLGKICKEKEMNAKFIIFYKKHQKIFSIYGINFSENFSQENLLKKEWRGLRNNDLVDVCGIKGAVFVHASGFTGANETLEGAIEMARQSF